MCVMNRATLALSSRTVMLITAPKARQCGKREIIRVKQKKRQRLNEKNVLLGNRIVLLKTRQQPKARTQSPCKTQPFLCGEGRPIIQFRVR